VLEKERGLKMSDTCGPLFDGLSKSADLQRCLENRLRQRLDANGSPEYALTWKYWTMQSGPPICALRASGHRISDSDCGGWPTARTCTASEATITEEAIAKCHERFPNLETVVTRAFLAGWPTGKASDWKGDRHAESAERELMRGNADLPVIAHQSGWPTATTSDTASSRDWKDTGDLEKSRFRKDGKERNDTVLRQAGMVLPSGTPAETESSAGYRLNPLFSLWLMGYPAEWAYSGARAMQSRRQSRQSS
jgi:hypothetical protein